MASTADFESFTRHGIIFCPENKEVVLFPQRVNNEYFALHRPVGITPFSAPEMWIARSPDLLHWGGHQYLFGGQGDWASGRVGAGTPPIAVRDGWLEILHGNQRPTRPGEVGAYFGAALLLAVGLVLGQQTGQWVKGAVGGVLAVFTPVLAAVGALPLSARASTNLKMMIPANPGGGWDSTARAMQPVIEEVGGVSAEVYNVGGAGGTIGLAQFVEDAAGDPHQLMVMGLVMVGAIVTNESAVTLDQVTPIASLTAEQEAIVVPADSEYQTLEDLVARFARGRDIGNDTTLEELGLSSLERVELLMAIEDRLQVTVDEAAYSGARTIGELRRLVETPRLPGADPVSRDTAFQAHGRGEAAVPVKFPTWNRRLPARALRRASLPTWILPTARLFARLKVQGLEHLRALDGPVVFAANHQSHMDTPAVLWALPARWRYRVAVAMAKEFFKAHFFPEQFGGRARVTSSLNYALASLFFNAFPIPQREAGTRQTLRYIGEVLADGFSVLIFPEGQRSVTAAVDRFRPGIGMIASRLRVSVVPVRVKGLEHVLAPSWWMARPGRVHVAFGAPLRLSGDDYAQLATQVEDAVRAL